MVSLLCSVCPMPGSFFAIEKSTIFMNAEFVKISWFSGRSLTCLDVGSVLTSAGFHPTVSFCRLDSGSPQAPPGMTVLVDRRYPPRRTPLRFMFFRSKNPPPSAPLALHQRVAPIVVAGIRRLRFSASAANSSLEKQNGEAQGQNRDCGQVRQGDDTQRRRAFRHGDRRQDEIDDQQWNQRQHEPENRGGLKDSSEFHGEGPRLLSEGATL